MIGKKISEIRKDRGFTLSELAERSNISKSYLSNIERDLNQNPSVEVVIKLANVLQVEIDTILSPILNQGNAQMIEKEWIDFIKELKRSGINKDQLHQYKTLIEFIQWQNNLSQNQCKRKYIVNEGEDNE